MIISLVLCIQNKNRIGWAWPVNTTFCQRLLKNKLWIRKGMYQALPKRISFLWKKSSTWQSKLSVLGAIHTSAMLPGSQTNHVASSPCWASSSQSTSCSFYTETTDLPLPQASSVACSSSWPWNWICSHPLLLLGATWAMWALALGRLNLLSRLQFDPTLRRVLMKRES